MIKFNGRQILKNGWGLDYTEPPAPTYRYLTFKAYSTGDYTFDPASGFAKVYTNSYIKDLTTGTTSQLNAGSGNDKMRWNITADHIYEVYWAPEDIAATKAYNPNNWNTVFPYFPSFNIFKELYSIDCWTMYDYFRNMATLVRYCEGIPQDGSLITKAENITWVGLQACFMNSQIKNNLEPFILKFNNIAVYRNYTFMNQTSAPDYSYCSSTYPNWF